MARRSEDIDKWVGQRIGELRRTHGLTQSALASSLGLSFQQIQKYEAGLNRVSAARLYQLSQRFDCPVSAFFPSDGAMSGAQIAPRSLDHARSLDHDCATLMANFPRIAEPNLRRSLLDVVEALALR